MPILMLNYYGFAAFRLTAIFPPELARPSVPLVWVVSSEMNFMSRTYMNVY
jgi:hypothetical protein